MATVQQQFRSSIASSKPGSLEPGQLAYNLEDSFGYLGNGGNSKVLRDGTIHQPAPLPGKGWLEFPLKVSDITALQEGAFVPAPSSLINPPAPPSNGQVLAWNDTANGGGGAYVPTTPDDGGATVLGELLNVSVPPVSVAATQQGGFLLRDTGVADESSAGAYKVSPSIDSGSYS